jgi:hypothetical protein
MACSLDKKCSVGGSGLQDSCVISAGEEVTYHYQVQLFGGYALVEVEDDKLGVIGQSSGETLTRTTTLTETTTNNASMTLIDIEPGCICLVSEFDDSLTVTVGTPTPTPTPTATPTPMPTPMGKVTVCHRGKNSISLPANAVPAHLAHGDTLGACP